MANHCPWHGPRTTQDELDLGLTDLEHYLQEEHMTTYRDRHHAGLHTAPDQQTERTVAQLKTALRTLGQPVTGSKPELEKRLADAQKNA